MSSDETAAQYLQEQFQNVNLSTTYNSNEDIPVNWDVLTTGADESMRGFINASNIPYYSSSGDIELLGHNEGYTMYMEPYPADVWDVSEDLVMDWELAGGYLRSFIDANAITSHTTSGKRALGINNGYWTFMDVSTGGAGTDTDELVKVSAGRDGRPISGGPVYQRQPGADL